MRTTLTLADDVAAALKRLQKKSDRSFKDLVNDLLRAGLKQTEAPKKPVKPFKTRAVDLGRCRLNHVDNAAELLAVAEGDGFR